MQRSDFHYELPVYLIAQQPTARRSASRLLCLDDAPRDLRMTELPAQLREGDLVVFNDTRVIPARLFGEKDSGGKVEILVERVLDGHAALAQVRASKPPKEGSRLKVDGTDAEFTVAGRDGEFYRLRLESLETVMHVLEAAGHMPLPPYVDRPDAAEDRERYQTLFAREPGAVAAPTAGLHFDDALLDAIRKRRADLGFLTLHVGAGTFQPVRVNDLSQHRMHRERVVIGPRLCEQIVATRARGGRVVAVGTTVVRALETLAAQPAPVHPYDGETEIFITPGYRFQMVDALLTNFHLPESTLLMLVCAFAGRERVMAAYEYAVKQRYRFFSYGDAMWIPGRLA